MERPNCDDTSEPQQPEGLRREILSSCLANLWEGARAVRNNALLRVIYDRLLRASEVRNLTLEGLSRDRNGYRLRVIRAKKRSKAQQGVVKTKFVHETTAAAIEAWCGLAGITQGTIFRGVAKSGQVLAAPISTKGVNQAMKRVAQAAGRDPRGFMSDRCLPGPAGLRHRYRLGHAGRGLVALRDAYLLQEEFDSRAVRDC